MEKKKICKYCSEKIEEEFMKKHEEYCDKNPKGKYSHKIRKMKDIKINTPFMKIQYWISWVGFILFGGWIIAIFLANYGENTDLNQPKKKGILNKTWQKFAFIQGSILGDIFIIALLIGLIFY